MKNWDYENEQWAQLPSHLKHLPIFTRHFDTTSFLLRLFWSGILKFLFKVYVRLHVHGSFKELYRNYPRLLIISNHGSHLDAPAITAAIPFRYWLDLYITAAKDYFFSNPVYTFFSKHCLGAIPIDRKDKKSEAINLCVTLLNNLNRIWLVLFPEGTRTPDGYVHDFKRGVSLFAEKTNTPILFLYIDGNTRLWPKGQGFSKPGRLDIYIGPVHPPAAIETINENYRAWVKTINPNAFQNPTLTSTSK